MFQCRSYRLFVSPHLGRPGSNRRPPSFKTSDTTPKNRVSASKTWVRQQVSTRDPETAANHPILVEPVCILADLAEADKARVAGFAGGLILARAEGRRRTNENVGNLDRIRLRAAVDEIDIQRVRVGQKIVANADAFAERRFTGHVVHLELMMGRTTIHTEWTIEQKDTKVREVLIELDPDSRRLPIDLQMTVRFLTVPDPPEVPSDSNVTDRG